MVVGRDGAAKFTDYFVGFSKLDAQRANGMIQFALRSSALFAQRLTERLPDAFEDEMAFLIDRARSQVSQPVACRAGSSFRSAPSRRLCSRSARASSARLAP